MSRLLAQAAPVPALAWGGKRPLGQAAASLQHRFSACATVPLCHCATCAACSARRQMRSLPSEHRHIKWCPWSQWTWERLYILGLCHRFCASARRSSAYCLPSATPYFCPHPHCAAGLPQPPWLPHYGQPRPLIPGDPWPERGAFQAFQAPPSRTKQRARGCAAWERSRCHLPWVSKMH